MQTNEYIGSFLKGPIFLYLKLDDVMKLDEAVEQKIEALIIEEGYELFDIKYFSAGGKRILRVFADGDTPIRLDQCAQISRSVSEYLDSIDFGNGEYTFEVSSPGADRPLVSARDFTRIIGKKVKVRLRDAEKKSDAKVDGLLLSVDDESIVVETKKGEKSVDLSNILSGKIDF